MWKETDDPDVLSHQPSSNADLMMCAHYGETDDICDRYGTICPACINGYFAFINVHR
jgi:hypothetical protein